MLPSQSVAVAVAVRCSCVWCVVLSSTSGETVRELALVHGAVVAGACCLLPAARAGVCCSCWRWSSRAACCSSHFDSKTGFRVGSSQPKTTQSVILEKFSKKKSFFRHNRHSATTVKPMAATMVPPFETRNAIAIWWHFFKKPPRHTAMEPP